MIRPPHRLKGTAAALVLAAPLLMLALTAGCFGPRDRMDRPGSDPVPEADERPPEELLEEIARRNRASRLHVLVRFERALTVQEFELIDAIGRSRESGLALHDFLGDHTFRAGAFGAAAAEFLRGELVSSVRRIPIEGRVDEALLAGEGSRKVRAHVGFYPDVPDAEIEALLESAAVTGSRFGFEGSWLVEGRADDIAGLGLLDQVRYVRLERAPQKHTVNEPSRASVGSGALHMFGPPPFPGGNQPTYGPGALTGAGVNAAVCGGHIDEAHPDFSTPSGGDSRFDPAWPTVDPAPGDVWNGDWAPIYLPNDHATHVAGVVGGDGRESGSASPSRPFGALRGHAPRVQLGNYPTVGGYAARIEYVATHGADLSVHSDDYDPYGDYGPASASIDCFLHGREPDGTWREIRPQAFLNSAGNNGSQQTAGQPTRGYFSILAAAKNALCVGSSDALPEQNVYPVSAFSSLGPTIDGRLKPDLVAPGVRRSYAPDKKKSLMQTALSSGSYPYGEHHGTSFAVGVVGGILALLVERDHELRGAEATPLYPSTWKALLAQSATDLVSISPPPAGMPTNPDTQSPTVYGPGPDWASGLGLVDAPQAVAAYSSSGHWLEASLAGTGLQQYWDVWIAPGTEELRVTLAWDDPEGAVYGNLVTTPRLVNDLDLELYRPFPLELNPATIRRPLTLAKLKRSSDGSEDQDGLDPLDAPTGPATPEINPVDNVEQTVIAWPDSGTWRVRIRANEINRPYPQHFSLASSHPLEITFLAALFEELALRFDWIPIVLPPESGIPRVPEGPAPRPVLDRKTHRFSVAPGAVFDVRSVARQLGVDLDHRGRSWEAGPGVSVRLSGLPEGARPVLIDLEGEAQFAVAGGASGGDTVQVSLDQTRLGSHIALIVLDQRGLPYPRDLDLALVIERR